MGILRITLVSALLFTLVSGDCTAPRVRKEWRSLCADERAAWINSVKCLTNMPHDPMISQTVDPAISQIPPITANSSYFDDFSYVHMDLNVFIHGTGFFLPWHRLFVQAFEDALRTWCGYEGVQPYWDWTKDTADVFHSTIFSDSEYDGIGSWGDPNSDYQIYTGSFKDMTVAYPVPHHIRRNFTLYYSLSGGSPVMLNTSFTREVVDGDVNNSTGDFVAFQVAVDDPEIPGPHTGPHFIVGGDMSGGCPFGMVPPDCVPGPKWAPNDPMFYLHHAMVDKVWYDWQRRDLSNKNAFGGGLISSAADPTVSSSEYPTGAPPWLDVDSLIPSDGLWGDTTVGDVLDTVGGRLCYIYE